MSLEKINLTFFGTSEIGLPALEQLHAADWCNIKQVVTQPDKPVGRKQILQPTVIKSKALELGIDVVHNHADIIPTDRGVLVSYGNILSKDILDSYTNGVLNIHPSLLPKWRGPSPIQYSLLNGETSTGVTIMKLDQGIDTGPTLGIKEYNIESDDTAITLTNKLGALGAELLLSLVPKYLEQEIEHHEQDNLEASYTKLIKKTDGKISGQESVQSIYNKYKAFQPWPGIYGIWQDKRIKLIDIDLKDNEIVINKIQVQGKPVMDYHAFINGYPDFLFSDIV